MAAFKTLFFFGFSCILAMAMAMPTTELEERIKFLERRYERLTRVISFKKSSVMTKMRTLDQRITSLEKRTLTIKRKQYTFPGLKMVKFSSDTEITRSIPTDVLPGTTRAVIVSIKCDEWLETFNAKLGLKMKQTGNKEGGWVEYTAPLNDFYYETLVPWDSVKGNMITFKPTGSSLNSYTIGIVGYVTQ